MCVEAEKEAKEGIISTYYYDQSMGGCEGAEYELFEALVKMEALAFTRSVKLSQQLFDFLMFFFILYGME